MFNYKEQTIALKNREKYNQINERETKIKKRMRMKEEDQEDNNIKKHGLFSKQFKSGFKEDFS